MSMMSQKPSLPIILRPKMKANLHRTEEGTIITPVGIVMAAQSFDMQSALSGGCIQQTPVSSSGQSQQTSQSTSASSLQQQQQAKHNALSGKANQSQSSQQQQQSSSANQASSTTATSSAATSQQSSVVVVASQSQQGDSSPSSGGHSQQASVVQQANNSNPQFITVAVSDQDSPSQSLQPAHHAYVHYVDNTSDPSSLYSTTNGQMSGYSVYSVSDSGTMYTPASTTYYNTGSGTAVSYSQVSPNVSQSLQGQLLTHSGSAGGTYLVQGTAIDSEGHALTHAAVTTARASPATIHLMEENGTYKVQAALLDASEHGLASAVAASARISPVSEDHRNKVSADILSSYSNEQCVIQTLHGTHDPQLQQQQQGSSGGQGSGGGSSSAVTGGPGASAQACSTHQGSQHQNVRDMDIIHVQWLIDNYETAEGVSLPRSTLYDHYLRHCKEHKLEPVNAASFGKLIRSVFLGLRTRRLGTRGNSKYHYYGIRVKPNSPLIAMLEEAGSPLLRSGSSSKSRYKSSPPTKADLTDSNSSTGGSVGGGGPGGESSASGGAGGGASSMQNHQSGNSSSGGPHQHQQYLGDASSAIPDCLDTTEFEGSLLPDGITEDDLETFKAIYREHCESFLEAVVSLEFSVVETLWQSFWRTHTGHTHNDQEKILSKARLFCLCKTEPVLAFVRKADYQFYQNLVEVLIPDVLRPIPSSLTQAIRNFAKSLEGWLTSAMVGCPQEVAKVKVSAVSAFAQTLRRYTSLNHLAQAARAVLQNASQISQMLADLNRVDFHNVQEQASWVCQCEEGMVQHLEQDFKLTLQQQNSLEQWAAWLEGVVALVLHPHEGKPDFPKAARQFLLKWSFYSSMVIRDLTLRSAASFGSFHLIRLLYDEYMFYLIEHRVAKATGETPIAVMGEFIGMGNRLYCGSGGSSNNAKDIITSSGNSSHRLAAALSAPMSSSHSRLLENGDCSASVGLLGGTGASSGYGLANGGMKDSSAAALSSIQQGLIGQPPVCIGSEMVVTSTPPTDSALGGPSKKMKVA